MCLPYAFGGEEGAGVRGVTGGGRGESVVLPGRASAAGPMMPKHGASRFR